MATASTEPASLRLPIRRNVALLSAALGANAAMLQLSAAVASISLDRVLGVKGLLGLGPAIVLAAGALAAVPAGRAIDRPGRVPVLAAGFGAGAVSCGLAALGSGGTLARLWLAAAAFELVGLVLVAAVRPDPKRIAALMRAGSAGQARTPAPIGGLLRRPGVVRALLASQASWSLMVAVMTLTGAVMMDHAHGEEHAIFGVIGAHFVGMYALVIIVGDLVDRIGRTRALSGGLLLMGISVSGLPWLQDAQAMGIALFGLGLGWNLSFVAATAELSARTDPSERASLLGFNDLLSAATGAGLTLLGGVALTAGGVAALATGAVVLVAIPAVWILRGAPRRTLEALR